MSADHDAEPVKYTPSGRPWRSRPPFQPGHTLTLKHGAYSPRKVEPLARELVDAQLEAAAEPGSPTAYLAEPSYAPALWAWARTEARVQLVHEWLMARGPDELDVHGDVYPASKLLNRLEARAESLRSKLGLDPLSRARLGRDLAAGQLDVAQLMAKAAEADTRAATADADDQGTGGDA